MLQLPKQTGVLGRPTGYYFMLPCGGSTFTAVADNNMRPGQELWVRVAAENNKLILQRALPPLEHVRTSRCLRLAVNSTETGWPEAAARHNC